MKYRRYKDSVWVDTSLTCPRDGKTIYIEIRKGIVLTDNFSCSRSGCTYPDYHSDELLVEVKKNIRIEKWIAY